MIILTATLAFVSAALIVMAMGLRRADPVVSRLEGIKSRTRLRRSALDRPFVERAVAPSVTAVAHLVMRLLPPAWLQATSQRLVWAGNPMPLSSFVLIWIAVTVALAAAGYLVADAAELQPIPGIACIVIMALFGLYLPQFWLRSRIAQRFYTVRKHLPDALDLMTTSVEAGMSLDAALMKVATYQTGPLQAELSRALEDMSLGKSRRQALQEVTERMPVPELVSFVQTLNQAEVTGAPIGQVLRVQAEQARIKRRQAAEAQAQRAPLLMLIPLILFIFPSLFIVLLSPVLLTVIDLLSSEGPFG